MSEPVAYRHGDALVSREQFYAIACDPRRSVAVEACAGAGKTWVLVSRILRALLDGAKPHEILAITFTRKAAGEMRKRLHDWLKEYAAAAPEQLAQALIQRGISLHSAPALHSLLSNLQQTVLAAGRPVQIRTFHSWFAGLLRAVPLAVLDQLGLPADHELLEDDADAIALVWRRFHAAVAADAEARADYEACVAAHGRFQTQKALLAALSKRVEFTLADAHGAVERSVRPCRELFPEFGAIGQPCDLIARAGPAWEPLLAAARALGRAAAPTFAAKGAQLEQALGAADFASAVDALLTQKGEARKFSDKLAGLQDVRAAQQMALRLAAACRQHEAWLHHRRITRLARVLIAQFSALKRERGWIDMNDVERTAFVMLSDDVLSGWVQERLDAGIRHLLIDEFQDTNPLQWQALHAWLQGYAGAGGGHAPSVFIVGDPKQSIYRFRRAEPQVFAAAKRFVEDGLGGDVLYCDHTHRTATGLLAAVNAVMATAQDAGEYEGFRRHTTERADAGGLFALPQIERQAVVARSGDAPPAELAWRDSLTTPRDVVEEKLITLECRQAAAWIAAQVAAGVRPQDVMVLSRKRERLGVMEDELRALHVAAQQPEKIELGEAPEVRDVVALLDVLVSPTHDLSLARALKSPLFGATDEALVQLALAARRAADAGESPAWFDVLQRMDLAPEIPPKWAECLRRWKASLDALPPHDVLEQIYFQADVLAVFAAAAPAPLRGAVVANLRTLLGAALQIGSARFATPYAFVRALKARGVHAPATANAAAVQLLTVHGAKGLEAPIVLLLDTDGAPQRAQTMGAIVDWPGEDVAPRHFAFLASEARPPACNAAALAADQAARRREELNALYVAMTRARERLVISSVQRGSSVDTGDAEGDEMDAGRVTAGSSWWQRLSPLAQPLPPPEVRGRGEAAAPHEAPFSLPNVPLQRFQTGSAATKKIADGDPDSPQSRFGQAVHRLLELRAKGDAAWKPALSRRIAREFELAPAAMRDAIAMAQRIAGGEGAWAWDAAVVDWQQNEVELVHRGERLRLDRLVRRADSGEWWVLDFKSAALPERDAALLDQMGRYRMAVAEAWPGAVVHCAFLTGQGRLVRTS